MTTYMLGIQCLSCQHVNDFKGTNWLCGPFPEGLPAKYRFDHEPCPERAPHPGDEHVKLKPLGPPAQEEDGPSGTAIGTPTAGSKSANGGIVAGARKDPIVKAPLCEEPWVEAAFGGPLNPNRDTELRRGGGMSGKSGPEKNEWARELVARLQSKPGQEGRLKLRKLLEGFGYAKRSWRNIDEIHGQLDERGIACEFTLTSPASLDDFVTLRLVTGEQGDRVVVVKEPEMVVETPVIKSRTHVVEVEQTPIERAVAATVKIATDQSCGSGFIVDSTGLVVTARHVVDADGITARTVPVILRPEKAEERKVDGTVIRSHSRLDFALLWLGVEGPLPAIPLGDPSTLRHAEELWAIGCPAGCANTVSKGVASNPRARVEGVDYIQTDTAIDPGNSGGPLINRAGEALGISVWARPGFAACRYVLPIDYLVEDIEAALRLGKEGCLGAAFCPVCGHLEDGQPSRYCRNCGREHKRKQG